MTCLGNMTLDTLAVDRRESLRLVQRGGTGRVPIRPEPPPRCTKCKPSVPTSCIIQNVAVVSSAVRAWVMWCRWEVRPAVWRSSHHRRHGRRRRRLLLSGGRRVERHVQRTDHHLETARYRLTFYVVVCYSTNDIVIRPVLDGY